MLGLGLSSVKIVCLEIAPLVVCGRQQLNNANKLSRCEPVVDSAYLCSTNFLEDFLLTYLLHDIIAQSDPENCGDPCCELACEDDLNLTVLYVNSHKYFVQAINYPNFTIRLVDATIQEDNCSSLPHYSTPTMLDIYSYGIYRGRSRTSLSDREISKPIYSIKCPNWVNSPLYVDAAACINGTSSNSTTTFSYLKFGRMNASDLLDSCSIELTVMTSWPVKDEFNLSFSDIRNALLYGFELSWFSVMCKKSCRGKYNSCDFDDSSNKVKCYDYVEENQARLNAPQIESRQMQNLYWPGTHASSTVVRSTTTALRQYGTSSRLRFTLSSSPNTKSLDSHSTLRYNDDTLNLQLKDMTLEFLWPIGRIKEALPELGGCVALSPKSCSSDTIKSIVGLVEVQNIPEAKVGLAA
ncbi:hypothetical protein LguiB_005785 [Lonicera macranthoides]